MAVMVDPMVVATAVDMAVDTVVDTVDTDEDTVDTVMVDRKFTIPIIG